MRFGDSGVPSASGRPLFLVMGDMMIRCLSLILPFAMVSGVNSLEDCLSSWLVRADMIVAGAVLEKDETNNKVSMRKVT